jgi:hypothetical protein
MERAVIGAGFILGLTLVALPSLAADRICTVADPTGTPLNVRADPNGAIVSTIDNGRSVRVIEERRVGQKPWLRIVADERAIGWVFGSYLDCTDDAMKSAPMKPLTPPG